MFIFKFVLWVSILSPQDVFPKLLEMVLITFPVCTFDVLGLQTCNLLLPLSMSFFVLFLQEIELGAPLLNLRPHIRDGNIGIHSNRVPVVWICLEVPHVASL